MESQERPLLLQEFCCSNVPSNCTFFTFHPSCISNQIRKRNNRLWNIMKLNKKNNGLRSKYLKLNFNTKFQILRSFLILLFNALDITTYLKKKRHEHIKSNICSHLPDQSGLDQNSQLALWIRWIQGCSDFRKFSAYLFSWTQEEKHTHTGLPTLTPL